MSKAYPGKYRVGFEDQQSNEDWELRPNGMTAPITSVDTGVVLAEVHPVMDNPDDIESQEEHLHTAELMAAAPELLEALAMVYWYWEQAGGPKGPTEIDDISSVRRLILQLGGKLEPPFID